MSFSTWPSSPLSPCPPLSFLLLHSLLPEPSHPQSHGFPAWTLTTFGNWPWLARLLPPAPACRLPPTWHIPMGSFRKCALLGLMIPKEQISVQARGFGGLGRGDSKPVGPKASHVSHVYPKCWVIDFEDHFRGSLLASGQCVSGKRPGIRNLWKREMGIEKPPSALLPLLYNHLRFNRETVREREREKIIPSPTPRRSLEFFHLWIWCSFSGSLIFIAYQDVVSIKTHMKYMESS